MLDEAMVKRCHALVLALALTAVSAQAQMQVTVKPSLPSLPSDDSDADAVTCRPPQPQTDSRLLGPKTCRPNKVWNDLHARGLDIGADGNSIVASEKYRNTRGQ